MGACRFLLLAHCTGVLRLLEVGHPRHGEIPRLSDAPARADRPAPLVELVMGGVPVDFGELIFGAGHRLRPAQDSLQPVDRVAQDLLQLVMTLCWLALLVGIVGGFCFCRLLLWLDNLRFVLVTTLMH